MFGITCVPSFYLRSAYRADWPGWLTNVLCCQIHIRTFAGDHHESNIIDKEYRVCRPRRQR